MLQDHEVEKIWRDLLIRIEITKGPPIVWIKSFYAEPWRKYHTWDHIVEGLELLFRHYQELDNPEVVIMAWIMHDVVYFPWRNDNEKCSSEFARSFLSGNFHPELVYPDMLFEVDEVFIQTVIELVLASDHQSQSVSIDAKYLLDIDLYPLAIDPPQFDKRSDWIRQQYKHVIDEDLFKAERLKILKKFIERTNIFLIQEFRNSYEVLARYNLSRHIELLQQ